MKKAVSIILTIVILLGAVPFCTAVKSALGVSDATAIEAVSGRYEYAVNYLKKHGKKTDGGEYIIDAIILERDGNFYVSAGYDETDGVFYGFISLEAKSVGVVSNMLISIEKSKSTYHAIIENNSAYGKDLAYTEIDPLTYYYGKGLTYSYIDHVWYSSSTKAATDRLFDSICKTGIALIDDLFGRIFGFGLDAFGFKNFGNSQSWYAVIFDGNSEDACTSSVNVGPDNKVTLPTPERNGYTCTGWSERKNASAADYACGAEYCPDSDITLYAVWKADSEPQNVFALNAGELSLIYRQTYTLESSAPNVTWISSDEKVANVDIYGNVTAVGKGTAVITATVKGTDISDSCKVNVSYTWWQWIIKILLLGFLWY